MVKKNEKPTTKKTPAKKKTAKKATGKASGRKSLFPGLNLDQVKMLVEAGHDDAFCAAFFGVSKTTWDNWKKKHPDFFEKLKDWKSVADGEVERALYELATGYEHDETKVFCSDGEIISCQVRKHYAPNPTAGIFWLKNRLPDKWRDKQEVKHEVSELDKLAEMILAGRKRAAENTEG